MQINAPVIVAELEIDLTDAEEIPVLLGGDFAGLPRGMRLDAAMLGAIWAHDPMHDMWASVQTARDAARTVEAAAE